MNWHLKNFHTLISLTYHSQQVPDSLSSPTQVGSQEDSLYDKENSCITLMAWERLTLVIMREDLILTAISNF